jgi:Holliday junction resolvase
MTAKKYSINTTLLNQKHATGVVSELKATEYLIKNGFLVFTNTSPNGLIDIIAVNDEGKIFLIDVKTITHRKKYKYPSKKEINRCPTLDQKKMGVILMMIDD